MYSYRSFSFLIIIVIFKIIIINLNYLLNYPASLKVSLKMVVYTWYCRSSGFMCGDAVHLDERREW